MPGPTGDIATSFDDAWAGFQALESLQLSGGPSEWQFTRGRVQNLVFLVRVEDAPARDHLHSIAEQLADVPGVEPFPDWFWHVTIKLAGFQVIKRAHEDDVLRQDVPRIAGGARALLSHEEAFEAQLGLVNGFASVVFLEVWDGGALGRLNARLGDGVPELPGYEIDGAGYLAHVSVARFTSDDSLVTLKEALSGLRSRGPGPTFSIRRLEFVKAWLSDEVTEFDTIASYALAPPRRAP